MPGLNPIETAPVAEKTPALKVHSAPGSSRRNWRNWPRLTGSLVRRYRSSSRSKSGRTGRRRPRVRLDPRLPGRRRLGLADAHRGVPREGPIPPGRGGGGGDRRVSPRRGGRGGASDQDGLLSEESTSRAARRPDRVAQVWQAQGRPPVDRAEELVDVPLRAVGRIERPTVPPDVDRPCPQPGGRDEEAVRPCGVPAEGGRRRVEVERGRQELRGDVGPEDRGPATDVRGHLRLVSSERSSPAAGPEGVGEGRGQPVAERAGRGAAPSLDQGPPATPRPERHAPHLPRVDLERQGGRGRRRQGRGRHRVAQPVADRHAQRIGPPRGVGVGALDDIAARAVGDHDPVGRGAVPQSIRAACARRRRTGRRCGRSPPRPRRGRRPSRKKDRGGVEQGGVTCSTPSAKVNV